MQQHTTTLRKPDAPARWKRRPQPDWVQRSNSERNGRAVHMLTQAQYLPRAEANRLRHRVVIEYLDVAGALARRYPCPAGERSDVLQVARMGLIKAIFRFCPEKGDDIVSFAAPTILGEIKQYLRDSSWWLRPPRRVQELAVTISHTEPMVNQMLGRSATTLELAGYLGVAQDDVVAAVTCLDFKYPLSLDAPVEPDTAASDTLGSLLAHDEDDYATREVPLVLREACKQLNLEERTIILYRFYKDWTQREIAQLLGVSQMHVSRSIQRALTILRNTLQRSTAQQ